MSQTGSIRGLTADGKSHHRATQVELTVSLWGDWRYGDGEIEEKKNLKKGKLKEIFSIAVVNRNILISSDCRTLTVSRAPTAFWRASARVRACTDPPVMTQADRDRVSETERRVTGWKIAFHITHNELNTFYPPRRFSHLKYIITLATLACYELVHLHLLWLIIHLSGD